jgi:integrase
MHRRLVLFEELFYSFTNAPHHALGHFDPRTCIGAIAVLRSSRPSVSAPAAGIPHCTIHGLRRPFCTDLAAAGVNQTICAKLAVHANPSATAKYYQAMTDEMARAAAQEVSLNRA